MKPVEYRTSPGRFPADNWEGPHAPTGLPKGDALNHASENSDPNAGVKCLRCDGTGRLSAVCESCKGLGVLVLSCRKCSGTGTYSQPSGPCGRCDAKGVLKDGTECPRCKGSKRQVAFSSACTRCSGTGSARLPCKVCRGSLKIEVSCKTCHGTGLFRSKA